MWLVWSERKQMMYRLLRFLGITAILLSLSAVGMAAGKFYIVDGTATDLITVAEWSHQV